ncbi:hypothetical protein [Leeuwenhoekiella aestuarii]|uniref:Lipocalin-like protein n=1 Tax=Leeuwenhoekiella aestuarii TaxID=2249426 RepID=A0A4Q0P090_9FLAO|nr:hypothetical protein [Leeuwenhoekiella aestuarii]RXG17986.1 hypothetical protein DSM04_101172 [Leeuwenhoekiella aestuarii]
MKVKLKQLLGLWRFTDDNLVIDFYVRQFDERTQTGLSFFTVCPKGNGEQETNYEWQGIPVVLNTPNELASIEIDNLTASETDSKYQDIKIWSFEINQMTLQFGDGTRIEFQKRL